MKGRFLMAFDGFITKTVCEELKTCLLDGKINKVFEPTKNEIVLSIYSHGSQYALLTILILINIVCI